MHRYDEAQLKQSARQRASPTMPIATERQLFETFNKQNEC